MPTYLNTQDVLNVPVSCFANYDTPANPATIRLSTWLRSTKYQAKNEVLRLETDKAKRDALKASLPAITPSAVFTYRQESSMVPGSHTRLIQFDIDPKDNPHIRNYDSLKEQISQLPFVAYCALSASGKGFWGLVPIADPERHSQHFDALKRVFAHYRINIDNKPRNVASLRGYSYDAAPYSPQQVMQFDLYDEPAKPNTHPFESTPDADADRMRIEVCIQEVLRQQAYIGNSYEEWYEVGCSLANTFGESGRAYYHHISQYYPDYQLAKTDKQFTACMKSNSQATLGTFFHLCKQIGIEWKDLVHSDLLTSTPMDYRPYWQFEGRTIYGEVLSVDPCNTYPSEWDQPCDKSAPILTISTNQPLAEVLAKCLDIPTIQVPLFQFFNQLNNSIHA
ncbi:PriCT-2 domain-containing protein [Spirosoma sp. KNUC1025]|uniref:PriCT-2 domain-containing protein n=1 Tax=Spirosoma sp. KNUC1025 TaxID=2894082 RepID=UPI00386B576F|nr:PriCT-2 domain-containing protein [Spirosoma sp. KNUC1025]